MSAQKVLTTGLTGQYLNFSKAQGHVFHYLLTASAKLPHCLMCVD